MHLRTILLASFIFIISFFLVPTPVSAEQISSYAPHELIVKLRIFSNEPSIISSVGGTVLERFGRDLIRISIPDQSVEQAQKTLSARSDVAYAVPNFTHTIAVPSDTVSPIELWNYAASYNATAAAILSNINNATPEVSLAHIADSHAEATFLQTGKSVYVEQSSSVMKDDVKATSAATIYVADAFVQGIATDTSLMRAVKRALENKNTIVGINASQEIVSPALLDVISDAHSSGIPVYWFHYQTTSEKLLDEFVTIHIPRPQTTENPKVQPVLYPAPTKIATQEQQNNENLIKIGDFTANITDRNGTDTLVVVAYVQDELKNAVAGAEVTVELITPSGRIFTGTDQTDMLGNVVFTLTDIPESGKYNIQVTKYQKSGYESQYPTPALAKLID